MTSEEGELGKAWWPGSEGFKGQVNEPLCYHGSEGFPGASVVKSLLSSQETGL